MFCMLPVLLGMHVAIANCRRELVRIGRNWNIRLYGGLDSGGLDHPA
ncbi:hypothetical protein [Kitasatospora herbaricolor]|uniref:Uncharacterized protein n=1 Tax=Kitasatospora herbaricolor TaxID=68217 RepID=A0ABZ1WD05_9ACTN|nr:hypothetical protein [Kitasatospora herbaricolor]